MSCSVYNNVNLVKVTKVHKNNRSVLRNFDIVNAKFDYLHMDGSLLIFTFNDPASGPSFLNANRIPMPPYHLT